MMLRTFCFFAVLGLFVSGCMSAPMPGTAHNKDEQVISQDGAVAAVRRAGAIISDPKTDLFTNAMLAALKHRLPIQTLKERLLEGVKDPTTYSESVGIDVYRALFALFGSSYDIVKSGLASPYARVRVEVLELLQKYGVPKWQEEIINEIVWKAFLEDTSIKVKTSAAEHLCSRGSVRALVVMALIVEDSDFSTMNVVRIFRAYEDKFYEASRLAFRRHIDLRESFKKVIKSFAPRLTAEKILQNASSLRWSSEKSKFYLSDTDKGDGLMNEEFWLRAKAYAAWLWFNEWCHEWDQVAPLMLERGNREKQK